MGEAGNSYRVHRTMKFVHSNIENLPLDVIGMLMNLLPAGGFEDCLNFFLAWAQTQRPSVILFFLNDFPLRAMYKFGNVGSAADNASFDRFFGIAESPGVHAAILYRRCREILCGVGDINVHLTVIDGLVRRGHFTSMVASFSLHNLYKKESIARSFHFLSGIFKHREFKDGIVPVLVNLESINPVSGRSVIGIESAVVGGGCHLHSAKETTLVEIESAGVVDCFFCTVGFILNVFSRKVANV